MHTTHTQVNTANQGYSLVETLVAISILLLAIVGPITIVAKSIQTATFAKEQAIATFLAQEGIEAVVADRNTAILDALDSGTVENGWTDWKDDPKLDNCFVGTGSGCNVDFRDSHPFNPTGRVKDCSTTSNCRLYIDDRDSQRSRYVTYTGSGATESPYTRIIRLNQQNSGENVQVKVTVSWESRLFAGERSVTVSTVLSGAYSSF